MRKAFDANVPKLKPKLKTAAVIVPENESETPDEHSESLENVTPDNTVAFTPAKKSIWNPDPASKSSSEPVSEHTTEEVTEPDTESDPDPVAESELIVSENSSSGPNESLIKEKVSEILDDLNMELTRGEEAVGQSIKQDKTVYPSIAQASPASVTPTVSVDLITDINTRRERLEKIKRKVAEAARAGIRIEPVSEDPTQATESILGLVSDLETQLSRSRTLEKALRIDLTEAKTELARTVTEVRVATERLSQTETQLDENRKVLEEMLVEMSALEEERDQAVRRAHLLKAQDDERQKQFEELSRHSAEMEEALSESKAEDERLLRELEECITENVRLRALLAEVTQERDDLAQHVDHLIKDRDEQIGAKKALEKVHKALAQARARLV